MSEDIPMKQCTGPCGQEYKATTKYWHKNKSGKYGLQAQCKICTKARIAKHYSKPEVQEHIREYRNRPEVKERHKKYQQEEKYKNHLKAYRNRPDVQKRRKIILKEYHAKPETKEKYHIYNHNRRARKEAIQGTYTHAQIQDQLKRQKHKCYYCKARLKKTKGKYIYHIEHTFPLSRVAGTDIPANSIDYIVLSCPTCNLSKGDKFPWEWAQGGRLL